MKAKIHIIHSFDVQPDVELVPSAYCPNKTLYFAGDPYDHIKHLRSIYSAEKERSEWIRKYENALNGLNYWKEKALEN